MQKKGFSIPEMIAVIAILALLATFSFKLFRSVIQRTRVVSTKAQISLLALAVEQVRSDTGYYPVCLADLSRTQPPLGYPENTWKGPYIDREVPPDGWNKPYVYKIPPSNVFDSPLVIRGYGSPVTETFPFQCPAGPAVLKIENYEVTSSSIYINGVEVVKENELNNRPVPQIITKQINLTASNTLETRTRSKPGTYFNVSIEALLPTKEYFTLRSYGRDGKPGGKGANKDIIWASDSYPNFQ